MANDLKEFLTRVREDSAFAEEVEAKGKSIIEAETISDKRELLVKVGKELSYEFTKDDIGKANADDKELSDDELAKVAGGYSVEEFLADIRGLCRLIP